MDENGLLSGDILLYHYKNGKEWEVLPNSYNSTKDGYLFFKATTSSFSYFAIVSDKKQIEDLSIAAGEPEGDDVTSAKDDEIDASQDNIKTEEKGLDSLTGRFISSQDLKSKQTYVIIIVLILITGLLILWKIKSKKR